jgi:hypothetical protein
MAMKNKIFLFFFIVIGVSGFQTLRADNALHLRFNLEAGYNFISTVTPGGDLIASYNDRLEAIRNVGFFTVSGFENLTTSTHIPSLGAEIVLFFNPRLSLSLGADFYVSSKAGYFDADVNDNEIYYTYYRQYVLKSRILPIKSAFRYRFPFQKFSVYLEGGLAFYIENIKSLTAYEDGWEQGTYKDTWEQGELTLWKARGRAIIPFLGAGLRFAVIKHVSLSLETGFPLGRIKSFKLRDCCEPWKNGEPLTLFDENGELSEYGHDFMGLNVGIFLVISL